MSKNSATRNGFMSDNCNMDKVGRIMRKYVTKVWINQYTNENIQFFMWVFDQEKPLKKMLIDP